MPRLGQDTNSAHAYPDRANANLRGSWIRQLLFTSVCTFVLYKIVFTDYKSATKQGMASKGLSEAAQEKIIPKTTREKARDQYMAKLSAGEKLLKLQWEVGNLTNAVNELQQLVVEQNGATIKHPISLGEPGNEEGGGDGAVGESEAGDPPAPMLRGGEEEDAGNPSEVGHSNGESTNTVGGGGDGGGSGSRRLSQGAGGEIGGGEGQGLAMYEDAATRPEGKGGQRGKRWQRQQQERRHPEGSLREEGEGWTRAENP